MPIDLAAETQTIDWYHQIELPGGIITPGVNNSKLALSRLKLPTSFEGKTILDIGAWDGFYSFEAARRGAARVLATDSFVWNGFRGPRGFQLARSQLGLQDKVEDQNIDIMDISPESLGAKFDVTFLLGVLYHLVDPISALERAASVTNELLVLETETALNLLPFPAARLWPTDELAHDPTNWWSINQRALVGLLKSFGFTQVKILYRTSVVRRVARAARRRTNLLEGLKGARIVIHAYR